MTDFDELVGTRMLRRAAKVPTEQPVGFLIAMFAISRIAFFLAGVRFATGDARGNVWQLLDFHLLRDNPIRSIWYLHSQPPFYNAFLAFVLHFPMGAQRTVVAVCWLILGLVTVIASYLLLVELRVPRLGALIVTIIAVIMSPSYALYENWGYSAYPCVCLLAVTALFLARHFRTGSRHAGFGFACGTASVVLLNSSYQWVWLLPVLLIPLLALRRGWRHALALVAVPVLLVGTWSVKNAVLFGTPTTSSWMGMNLAKMTLEAAPPATIQQLVDTGTLTTLALVPPFQSPDAYVPRFARELPRTGVPALDERYKIDTQTSFLIGSPNPLDSVNYNNKVYVVVSKDYLRDDIAFIKAKPRVYLHAVGMGAATFFASADQYIFFMKPYSANWDEIGGYTKLYDTLVEWQPKTDRTLFYSTLAEHKTPSALTHSYFAIAAFVLTILMVPFMVKSRRRDPAFRWTLAFVWVTVVYATAVSCLVELGENNRFRFELGPLPTIAAVALVVELARSFRARRRHGSPSGEDAGGV